ncbi:leucine-rich repeat protein [Parafilimonas terrae]|uniref:Leucine-rich repeat (LRR) protein n=1 Tax=Parafilimonas terrae TaxID=1465490 RepID=A0A1I5YR47_9BACT|nr:leucine-rich repeat protein [Parafilimonas terrae]SFQ46622.1 Leucine-rich repeat (LRR) protein [Parafilimonas terrae]
MSSYNISPAEQLIEQNIRNRSKLLDLGNCSLHDKSPELFLLQKCDHIETLSLGTYYYINDKPVLSANKERPNLFNNIPESLPVSIKELYINETKIRDISKLAQYKNLTHFDGFGNNIAQITISDELPNLISLGLSNNDLNVTDQLELFPNLKYLYIGNNRISFFKKNLKDILPYLEVLYMYGNYMTNISFLQHHHSIKKLDLSNNELTDINVLEDLFNLEQLEIGKNPATREMPKEVLQSRNAAEIRSLIKKISLPQLLIEDSKPKEQKFLDLGNCGLTDNSHELKLLAQCNHLTGLSLGMAYYDEAGKYIESSNRQLTNIFNAVPATLPPALTGLQIRNTVIQNISNVNHLSSLMLLDLSNNKIKSIENIEQLNSLHELALHGNEITGINDVQFPPNLKTLHLSYNKITSIDGIEACKNLDSLIIYSNQISKLQPVIKLPSLKTLNIQGNPITDCPSDVWIDNDISQIRAYFNEMSASKNISASPEFPETFTAEKIAADEEILDVKLIILGNSNVGKTNLVNYLETGECLKKRNSTHGFEVKRWKPDIVKYPQLKNVEVSIWDFGGQEYYHDTYKLFLSNNAVYVVMWSADSDFSDKKEEVLHDDKPKQVIEHFELAYWLDTVKSFRNDINNTPLLVVQNKVDDLQQKRRIAQDIHSEYGIDESFHISLLNGSTQPGTIHARNLQGFTDYLAEQLHELAIKNKHAQFSEDFKYIRQEVLNLNEEGKPSIFGNEDELYIDKQTFYDICKKSRPGINPEHYPVWLYNSGALIYFEKNNLLNDRIFINPRKLSEKIYNVLNNNVLKNYGEILIDDDLKKNQLIIDVMISLGILYPHPAKSTTHYLAPQYLPEDHPIEDLFKIASSNAWQDSYWIKVPIFFYKKLMHHLLLCFIADDSIEARYFWKNGIMILKKNNINNGQVVLIKGLFPSEKKGIIQISVEDNSSDLQKEIFEKIYSFTMNNNEAAQGTANTDQQNYFLEKLELSVDKMEYIKYNRLKELAVSSINDTDNELLKFKHIVPFEVKGTMPKNIFVSYSHNNTIWLAKIRNHLAGLRRSNYIKEWTDQEIMAGDKWDLKIKEQLKKADIFILLLSADFIASEYIWQTELKEAIQSKKTIIPIYIESCDFTASPFIQGEKISDFEIVPKYENHLKPVSLWANEAEALSVIAMKIRQVIEEKDKPQRAI